MVRSLLKDEEHLNDWEIQFLRDILPRKRLTLLQNDRLERIHDKVFELKRLQKKRAVLGSRLRKRRM